MSQPQTTPLTLGPGERILDQNLHAQIDKIEPLSPGDLLKIANFYQVSDPALANHLVLMAMKVISKELVLQNSQPAPGVARATAFAVAASAQPLNEWQDQLEDFLNGAADPEDRSVFRATSRPKDVRWLPFSTSLPGLGLLIETTTLNDDMYLIGVAPDPKSLSSDD